jgi:ABC-type nitrate/sulfonate/bicarbonate transport system substrate-binding protein
MVCHDVGLHVGLRVGLRAVSGRLVQYGLALALLSGFSACTSGAEGSEAKRADGYETLVLRAEGFAGTVMFPELAEDLGYLAPLKLQYVGNSISGPASIQNVVTGDTEFGGAFNGSVIKLIAAKAPITAVMGYYGVDDQTWTGFFVLDGSPIRAAKDLIGKKVAMNTLGAHHEFMLKEYLGRSGLTTAQANQVTLVVVPPTNAEQSLRQRQVEVATLGTILRDHALERGGIHSLFSDYDLFGKFTAGSYVMRNDFIRKNPNTVRKFVQATGRAIEWARTTPRDEVVARFEKIVHGRGRNENAAPLKHWQSTGVASKGGRLSDADFQVWIDWLVKDGELAPKQVTAKQLYTTQFYAPEPG